jgi:apolipoprotein N-acyltransferase
VTTTIAEGRAENHPSLGAAFGLTLLSAGLAVVASPPLDLWPLAFVSWAPLFVALRGRSPAVAFLLGGAREFAMNVVGFAWIPAVVRTLGDIPDSVSWALALAFFVCGAGRTALMAWVAARAERNGWAPAWVLVLALAGSESLYPLLFPWYSAIQVHGLPILLQLAELGGPVLVGIPLATTSLAVARAAQALGRGGVIDRRCVALAAFGPAVMLVFGAARAGDIERAIAAAPKVEVGFVQGNAPREGLALERSIALHRDATLRMLEQGPLDLVVWPEGALGGAVPSEAIGPLLRSVTVRPDGIASLPIPILTGTAIRRGDAVTNSAVLFADGAVRGVYDKVHPLAFGETLPLGESIPALRRWLPQAGAIAAGAKVVALELGEPAIAQLDPELLVNLTNDSWFGRSSAAGMHLALAQFRAVEHRRYLVHAASTGVSAFVDPMGRATGLTPLLGAARERATLRWMRARTLYERIGDAPWHVAALLALMAAFLRRDALARWACHASWQGGVTCKMQSGAAESGKASRDAARRRHTQRPERA